jgi:hypothetical protein
MMMILQENSKTKTKKNKKRYKIYVYVYVSMPMSIAIVYRLSLGASVRLAVWECSRFFHMMSDHLPPQVERSEQAWPLLPQPPPQKNSSAKIEQVPAVLFCGGFTSSNIHPGFLGSSRASRRVTFDTLMSEAGRSWSMLLAATMMLAGAGGLMQPAVKNAGQPAASRVASTCPLGSTDPACQVRPYTIQLWRSELYA